MFSKIGRGPAARAADFAQGGAFAAQERTPIRAQAGF